MAKSETSPMKPSFLNRFGEWTGIGVKESGGVSHRLLHLFRQIAQITSMPHPYCRAQMEKCV